MATSYYRKALLIENLKDHPAISVRFIDANTIVIRQEDAAIRINNQAAKVLGQFIRDFIGE